MVRLLNPETKRFGEGSAWGRGTGGFGGAKADMENMRRKPDLATAAAIAAAAAAAGVLVVVLVLILVVVVVLVLVLVVVVVVVLGAGGRQDGAGLAGDGELGEAELLGLRLRRHAQEREQQDGGEERHLERRGSHGWTGRPLALGRWTRRV